MKGISEIVIYCYLFTFSVVLYNFLLCRTVISSAIQGVILGTITGLLVAYSIKFLGFPNIPQWSMNLQGTFVNGSQLGHYLFFVILLIIPLLLFGPDDLKKKGMVFTILFACVSMLLASKRSALAAGGFLIALMIFYHGVMRGQLARALLLLFTGGACLGVGYFLVFSYLLNSSESTYFLERLSIIKSAGLESEFLNDNTEAAICYFKDNPLTGVGLASGAVEMTDSDYELHSTFFKFLGDGGVFMVISGLWLIAAMGIHGIRHQRFSFRDHLTLINAFRIAYLSVFLLNCWAYSIRRREMWFVVAIVEAIKFAVPQSGNQGTHDMSIDNQSDNNSPLLKTKQQKNVHINCPPPNMPSYSQKIIS